MTPPAARLGGFVTQEYERAILTHLRVREAQAAAATDEERAALEPLRVETRAAALEQRILRGRRIRAALQLPYGAVP